jgi:hypothetical protein
MTLIYRDKANRRNPHAEKNQSLPPMNTDEPDQKYSMTSEDHARLFALFDDRARRLHNYSLAELFPNTEETGYFLCFLPEDMVGSSHPTSCRYIHIDKAEALMAIQHKSLTPSMIKNLDRELSTFCDEM